MVVNKKMLPIVCLFLLMGCTQEGAIQNKKPVYQANMAKVPYSSHLKQEWLFHVFPSIENCVPRDLYFDDSLSHTNALFLEKKGYNHPHLVDGGHVKEEGVAVYDINETFLGFKAIKLTIPRKEGGAWEVQVQANAKELADRIYQYTHKRIKIYEENQANADPGIAVLREHGQISVFECYLAEGED